jgi:DNA excision repair protein ERCC-4
VISVTAMNRSTNPLQQACMRPGDDETRVCDGSTGETRPALIADPLAPPLAVVPTRVPPAPRREAPAVGRIPVPPPRRSHPAKRRAAMPTDLSPNDLVAVIDSREQHPLDLAPLRSRIATLSTGDYSLRGLESVVAIERKSLTDLLLNVGQGRDRFHREVMRLLAYPVRALVVESTWPELERGEWRSKVSNTAALGTVLNWIGMGLPVIMAADHARAGRYVSRLLFLAARRRWREARGLWPWFAR